MTESANKLLFIDYILIAVFESGLVISVLVPSVLHNPPSFSHIGIDSVQSATLCVPAFPFTYVLKSRVVRYTNSRLIVTLYRDGNNWGPFVCLRADHVFVRQACYITFTLLPSPS